MRFDPRPWSRTNPPASALERRAARKVADSVARTLVASRARAVLLAGSWARGDAHRHSDIDLWSIGGRSGHLTLWRAPYMVNVFRTTERVERRHLKDPAHLAVVVPAWRQALPLHDPEGIARRIRREAVRFRWAPLGPKCDRWVARSLSEWAEEALKLVRALAEGNLATAAVQRNRLIEGLVSAVTIHRRLLPTSENELWNQVGESTMGEWGRLVRQAMALDSSDGVNSCRAALALYSETARIVWPLFNRQQREIVSDTGRVIGYPVVPSPSSL